MKPDAQLNIKELLKEQPKEDTVSNFKLDTPFTHFVKEVAGIEDHCPPAQEFGTLKTIFQGYLANITRFLANNLDYIEKIRYNSAVFNAIDEYGESFINARIEMNAFDIDAADSFAHFQAKVKKAGFDYEVLASLLLKAKVIAVV